jgi:hypothetical protein
MFFLFDHLNSILIAAAVILILGAVQIGARRTGLEQTTSYATKSKAISFGEWMEDDILSIGANFGRNRYRFQAPENDENGNTIRFVFYSDSVEADDDTLRMMTRYRLYHIRTVLRNGVELPLYQVERHLAYVPVVNGVAPPPPDGSVVVGGTPGPDAWTADGRSLETLSGFHIGLLERDGRETNNVERGDFIRVNFRLVPEFPIEPEYLRELYWTTTLKVRPFWEPPPTS